MAYHHGDLREAILAAAAAAIARDGVASLSLRALARDVGVTHTAPRHHFGDKRGVLTALAARGYRRLAARVRTANEQGSFLDAGVAYVEFALADPASFQVMFRPDLVDQEDRELRTALDELYDALTSGVRAFGEGREAGASGADVRSVAAAAWSMAHGFATLALSGNFGPDADLTNLARQTLRHLSPG